jgi:hypothetical protein
VDLDSKNDHIMSKIDNAITDDSKYSRNLNTTYVAVS